MKYGSATSDTVEHILECTVEVIASHGLEESSMRMIAERAGISKSLLHYHFNSREDLLLQALQWMAREILNNGSMESDGTEEAEQSIKRTVRTAIHAFRNLQTSPERSGFFTAMYAGSVYNKKLAEKMQDFHVEEAQLIERMIYQTMGAKNTESLNLPVKRVIRLMQTLIIGLTIQRVLGYTEMESASCFEDALFLISGVKFDAA